jgi:PAS domain S-box-containing protein
MTVHLAADISYRLALLDAVTDGAHEGIIALDLTGTIIGWNRAAQRIYQYSAEEVVGQHTAILVPPDRLAELEQKLQRIRNGEGIEQYETVRRRKDGQPIHVALVSIPLRDSTGQLLGAAALVRDITARRRDEEVLRQSQTRLRLLVEQMPAVVWTVDEQLRFTSSLGAGLAGLNLRPNETVGRTLAEFFQADDPEFLPIAMHRRALAGESVSFDMQWMGVTYHVHIEPYHDALGRLAGAVGVAMDISEKVEAEQEIRRLNAELEQRVSERTAELAAINDELEAFSYSVSHDLRAPLRSIDGFSAALAEECGSQLDPRGHNYLGRVRASCQRMAELIEALLSLARLSRGELRREPLDLAELARAIAAELRERDPSRQVDFLIADRLPAVGDPRLLRIVMENLLSNAWKFTSRRPRAAIRVGSVPSQQGIAYSVRDDGAGFDMAYAERLFSPFQRLHSRDQFEGTGIGLATASRIIRRHGGRMWADAAPEQGAAFYFTLAETMRDGSE